jgi:thiol-disulfide isomerase/thioredoxin
MKKSIVASLIVLPLILTGCSSDPLAEQYLEGSNKNYIAGDGTITEIPASNRSEPVEFRGEIENGDIVTSQQYLGNVLVVNFWYAGCAPCRAEARDLEQVYQDTSPQGVNFLGVNVRDQAATALAFSETFGVTYPSIIDQDGQTQMAFSSNVPPNAVPTTVVLDAQGRVAARILGQLTDPSILETLIEDISAESTP